jgi:LytS/YehU family sensor histidine kinase
VYFILVLAACYFIIAFLPEILIPFQGHGHTAPPATPVPGAGPASDPGFHFGGKRFLFRMGHNLVFFLAIIFFSLLLKINNRLKQMEREKLKAELSYFKAQINPHFLFNTLNSIYSLAIQKDDKTPEAVVKLSGMMRFVITDASNDFVPLDKEISYITDYVDLQKIRFGDTVKIDYQPCEAVPGKYIAPLILIAFIENAFKFGVNPESDSFISIRITFTEQELLLSIFNHKVRDRNDNEPSGGLGIINARQRLALLYPEKHRLIIEDGESHFKVDLYINLP